MVYCLLPFLSHLYRTLCVPCSNNRELQYIDLQQNSFSGPLQDRFNETGLNQLIGLSLNDNDFSGPIPPSLEGLDAVRILALFNNKFEGPVPENICNIRGPAGLRFFEVDCDGDPVANECSCCTYCCDREARTCSDVEGRRLELERQEAETHRLALEEEARVKHHDFAFHHEFIPNAHRIFPQPRRNLQGQQGGCTVEYRWIPETGELVLVSEAQ